MKDTTKYQPLAIESKWQRQWEQSGIYQPDLTGAKRPFYNLMMFPYPSAEGLHVGNMYAFTGADIYGRFKRMRGFDVFEPIGLDGFGIHSENYAIKIGKHPSEQAKVSEKNFYRQLHAIGNGFAWKNHLKTYDPDYYRWTQWIFVQMFKHGLAYRKKSLVNFCPSCKTVLSDEQVIDGLCERCKTTVEKREMEQWFFKITAYAEKLLQNTFRESFKWSEKVKIGQRNWIGKKEGINITYDIEGTKEKITVFTTRPDTNFGATFIVIGPEHPFVNFLLTSAFARGPLAKTVMTIKSYVEKSKKKSEVERIAEGREKTGVFTGFYCINQLTNYKMPIWISDFILMSVGTGAVVGVPGHDLRDFEFAKKFDIPIIRVVVGKGGDKSEITRAEQVQEEEGKMTNSGFLDGMEIHQAIGAMMDHLEEKGWGKRVTTYKLRDWCISRQRYWGAPIPMIFCASCAEKGIGASIEYIGTRKKYLGKKKSETPNTKYSSPNTHIDSLTPKYQFLDTEDMPGWYPVPEDQLPVLLPENVKDWKPEGTGKGPLAKIASFVNTKCPECGGDAKRETDVCDTFLDSSWYHMRYPSVNRQQITDNKKQKINSQPTTHNSQLPWDPAITKKWLPVTQYIGGAEHTVLHLLYARFVAMVFHDLGLVNFDEPYTRFYAHGLIIAEGAKMSKSRGNIVVPDAYIDKYGADTLRTYLMFLGPFDHGGDFRDTGIAGMYRFLSRVWRLVSESLSPKSPKLALSEVEGLRKSPRSLKGDNPQPTTHNLQLDRFMHRAIKEVSEDMENLRYNTAIAHIMEYVNFLTHNSQLTTHNSIEALLLLLAPFAPHMTEELYQNLKSQISNLKSDQLDQFDSIHKSLWPKYNPKFLIEEEVTIIVQVNGKTRDVIKVSSSKLDQLVQSDQSKVVEKAALSSPKVQKYLSSPSIPPTPSNPPKVIFIPGKLINFVI